MTWKVSIIGLGLVCCCWLSVLLAVSAAADEKKEKDSPKLDVICLGCICEAASGCNQTLGCVGDVCGPFHITQIYWTDSGKPTLDNDKPDDTDEEGLRRRRRDRLRGLRAHPLSRRLRLLGGCQARQELRQSFQLLPEGVPSCLMYKRYDVVKKRKQRASTPMRPQWQQQSTRQLCSLAAQQQKKQQTESRVERQFGITNASLRTLQQCERCGLQQYRRTAAATRPLERQPRLSTDQSQVRTYLHDIRRQLQRRVGPDAFPHRLQARMPHDLVEKFLEAVGQAPDCPPPRESIDLPLILALRLGKRRVAELLLRRGADPNLANGAGFTPLHFICSRNDPELVESFFEICDENRRPVKVDARSALGDTPLHLALRVGNGKAVELLLRGGADPMSLSKEGSTPLHIIIICQMGVDGDSMETFFKIYDEKHRVVQVDAKDMLARTPLQMAVTYVKPRNIDLLLDRGADLSSFVFPTERDFVRAFAGERSSMTDRLDFKLLLASGAVACVERLEKRGYQPDPRDVLAIMKLFAVYELFEKSADVEGRWRDDERLFARIAKDTMIKPDLSLQDLIREQLATKRSVANDGALPQGKVPDQVLRGGLAADHLHERAGVRQGPGHPRAAQRHTLRRRGDVTEEETEDDEDDDDDKAASSEVGATATEIKSSSGGGSSSKPT
ncbi:unnamed protein product [Trichogramma brassicae]|uniref:lysozyme n=1 Tax=Trichogramma brassicae TaxID=86971 RepID=A0A6H5IIC3_9HYME|nr:unnamed protein product [Trichogramma brassicae]